MSVNNDVEQLCKKGYVDRIDEQKHIIDIRIKRAIEAMKTLHISYGLYTRKFYI